MEDILKSIIDGNSKTLNKYISPINKRDNVEFYPYIDDIDFYKNRVENVSLKETQLDKDIEVINVEVRNVEVRDVEVRDVENEFVINKNNEIIQDVVFDFNDYKKEASLNKEDINSLLDNPDELYNISKFIDKKNQNDKFREVLSKDVSKTVSNLNEEKTRDELKASRIENEATIRNIYEYLFNTIYKFHLVYDELKDSLNDFKKMNVVEKVELATTVDVETYLKRFRSGSLILKFNLIAFQLGKYNYEILMNNLTEELFLTPDKEFFSKKICQEYKGSEIDISYLKVFHEIVKAEESGLYVFNDIKKEENENKEVKEPIKENKKSLLGLGSFKLKK